MRVMLVYSNRTRVLVPAPPIGLSYVATATRRAGHEVRFVDLMFSRDPHAALREALHEFKPHVVGFSVRNIDNVVAQRVAWHLDELSALLATVRAHSVARIVLGGPAISILGPGALGRLDADFAVVGEGEIAFPKLLSAMASAGQYSEIPGLCYRDEGRIASVPLQRQECVGDSGMEEWIRWDSYENAGGTWAVHTKRGCPHSCFYCNYPVMEGHHLRQRSAKEVVDEIERVLATVSPRTFEFTDSTFNVPESHARAICDEILRRGLRVNLSAVGINPGGISEGLFPLMKRAGFRSLVITADAASGTMLRRLRKGFTIEQVRRAAAWARESGIRCTWFFLLGGPGETSATVEETIAFVEEHLNWKRCLTIIMTGVRILPGTEMARRAVEEGCIRADSDLCEPSFYFSPEVEEQWVLDRINEAIARCPAIVHGAEENGSLLERVFHRTLHCLGVAPPYYRFLPLLLRLPAMGLLRARHNGVRASVPLRVYPAPAPHGTVDGAAHTLRR